MLLAKQTPLIENLHCPPRQQQIQTKAIADAHELRDIVLLAIEKCDTTLLGDILDKSLLLRTKLVLRCVLLPMTFGLAALSAHRKSLSEWDEIGQKLRRQIRMKLISLPRLPISRWLVPATSTELTATYVTALTLALRGIGTKIWPWPLSPPGPMLIVGDTYLRKIS